MYNIGMIGMRPAAPVPQATGMAASASGFQIGGSAALSPPAARSVFSTATPSLGPQTVSTLLQTQDLSQTQARGGHGGGGHHAGMKMMPGLEAEQEVEGEEAQMTQRRKKLADAQKTMLAQESDETGEENTDADTEGEEKQPERNKAKR